MKRIVLSFFCMFLSCLIFADGKQKLDLEQTVQLSAERVQLKEILSKLEAESVFLIYGSNQLPFDDYLNFETNQPTILRVLEVIKKDLLIESKIINNKIVFKLPAKVYTISGTIRDASNGESLIGAQVYFPEWGKGCITNYYGFYSISLPADEYLMKVSYIGFDNYSKQIHLNTDTKIDIDLFPESVELGEVEVVAKKEKNIHNVGLNGQHISMERVKSIPTMLGEPDVLKSLQLLPGVQTAHEGTNNLSVRGGSFDQNLILLDEAPLYNPSHTLGIFSAINADAVNNMEFFKGEMPARYGGRLSSVIDIRMKEGNSKKFAMAGNVGLLSSKLSVEAPIIKDRTSFILSTRYSYAGYTADGASVLGDAIGFDDLHKNFRKGNDVQFYDLNFKINHRINKNNRIYLSAYSGKDQFYFRSFSDKMNMQWGNNTATLRWNTIVSDKIFHNFSAIYSNYNYSYKLLDDSRQFLWTAGLSEMKAKSDWDYFMNPNNHLRFGIEASKLDFDPGSIQPRGSQSNSVEIKLPNRKATQFAAYISNEQNLSQRWKAYYGLRASVFSGESGELDSKSYYALEPRLSLGYLLTENVSMKASYIHTVQNLHKISNSSLGLPTDIWLPAASDIRPQSADQYSLGVYTDWKDDTFEFSAEVFGKQMHDIIDFKDNAELFVNPQVAEEILPGEGRAYGLELLLQKKKGRTQFWLSYTLSKAEFQIDGINEDNWYPARYDRRHSLKLTLTHSLSKAWSVSSNFVYSTGSATTIPIGIFEFKGSSFIEYSDRNAYRLPDYHRLDIAFKYVPSKNSQRRWKSEWNFGLYNVYGRKNVFSLYLRQNDYQLQQQQAYQIYLFTFMPNVSYSFKF